MYQGVLLRCEDVALTSTLLSVIGGYSLNRSFVSQT